MVKMIHKVATVLHTSTQDLLLYPKQASCRSPVSGCKVRTANIAMLAEHHDCYVHCLTNLDCSAAEDIADLGVCYSAGLQALVGETKVHLWQKGDVLSSYMQMQHGIVGCTLICCLASERWSSTRTARCACLSKNSRTHLWRAAHNAFASGAVLRPWGTGIPSKRNMQIESEALLFAVHPFVLSCAYLCIPALPPCLR